MPPKVSVPKVRGAEIERSGIPRVQVGTQAPSEEFFGASSQGFKNASNDIVKQAINFKLREKQKADEIAFQDADLEAAKFQASLEQEAFNLLGKDSAGAQDFVEKNWFPKMDQIESSLSNDAQKQAFRRAVDVRFSNTNLRVQKHVSTELFRYDEQSTSDYINNARNEAAKNYLDKVDGTFDSDAIQLSILQQEEAFLAHARRKGIGAEGVQQGTKLSDIDSEQVKSGLRNIRTKTHIAVITQMISEGRASLAKEYYQDNKEQIDAGEGKEILGLITEQSLQQDYDKRADKIVESVGNNLNQIEELINKIDDEEAKKNIKDRVDILVERRYQELDVSGADRAKRIAEGNYNVGTLKGEQQQMSSVEFNAIMNSLNTKPGTLGKKKEKSKKYRSLLNKYNELGSADKTSKDWIDFRLEVYANKAFLKKDDYKNLLLRSDRNFLEKEKLNWIGNLQQWWGSIFDDNDDSYNDVNNNIVERAKSEDVSNLNKIAREEIDKEITKNNPNKAIYEIGKFYQTPLGMREVKDFNQKGEPVFILLAEDKERLRKLK